MKKAFFTLGVAVLCSATMAVSQASAGVLDFWRPRGKDAQLSKKVQDCEKVVNELFQGAGKDIPKNLLKDAEAVVIFSDSVAGSCSGVSDA